MLTQLFDTPIALGLAQATATALLSLLVVAIARSQDVHLERDTLVALLRGIIQVTAVGSVLVLVFQGPAVTGVLVLVGMTILAAYTASRRVKDVPAAFWVSLQGIGFGAGLVIAVMTALGVIDSAMTALIPVGSMVIANAMNTNTQALERFRAEVLAHRGHIEAALALGAAPHRSVAPYVQAAVQASLIPRIDSLRTLGIVWIPGVMTGMILAGSDPIYASIYQFVVIAMIFASSGLTSVASTLLIRARAFTTAEQLVLRAPEEG